jgi:sugar phosphate isomerase/epimerase
MSIDRRDFLSAFAAAAATAGLPAPADADAGRSPQAPPQTSTPGQSPGQTPAVAVTAPGAGPGKLSEKDRLLRIASNSYAVRALFKSRNAGRGGGQSEAMKKQYGEITMLDFPRFTRDTYPGVTHMDIFSSLMGDITDDSMFTKRPDGGPGTFDPSSPSGRKWLEQMAARSAAAGVKVHHISNNAPTNLASTDDALRKEGVAIGKRWLDGAVILGARSVRMNSVTALGPPLRPPAIPRSSDGYPRNTDIVLPLAKAIESYKEMADHGGMLGIKVTIENHWGLAADPINMRIILDEVNHPYCEASPDFCNWEYEYMLVSGLKAVAPYAHTNVHAKYWDRWGEFNNVRRSTKIMLAAGFKGTFALEYETGPLNGVEGSKYLFKEVMAALEEFA